MKQEKLVSVIIPTYNRGKLIKKSINSVLNQTYKNIEIIVVDDSSTDNTRDVIKTLNDNRIKYYSYKGNKGACYARNFGIKKAKGEYIAFQDSDDIFRKNKIEKQIRNLLINNSDIDFCKVCIHPNELIVPDNNIEKDILNCNIHEMLCDRGNFISTQAIVAKKKVFDKEIFDIKLQRFQDYDLVLRLSHQYSFSFSNEILVDLYQQKDSISKSINKLFNAIGLMIQKEYKFNKDNLVNTLLNICVNSYLLSDESIYNQILKNKEETIAKLNEDNQKLINENIKIYDLMNEKDVLINSLQKKKTNKHKNKLRKIINPLKKISSGIKRNKL